MSLALLYDALDFPGASPGLTLLDVEFRELAYFYYSVWGLTLGELDSRSACPAQQGPSCSTAHRVPENGSKESSSSQPWKWMALGLWVLF